MKRKSQVKYDLENVSDFQSFRQIPGLYFDMDFISTS